MARAATEAEQVRCGASAPPWTARQLQRNVRTRPHQDRPRSGGGKAAEHPTLRTPTSENAVHAKFAEDAQDEARRSGLQAAGRNNDHPGLCAHASRKVRLRFGEEPSAAGQPAVSLPPIKVLVPVVTHRTSVNHPDELDLVDAIYDRLPRMYLSSSSGDVGAGISMSIVIYGSFTSSVLNPVQQPCGNAARVVRAQPV